MTITPAVVHDMDEGLYHSHPALSVTRAKLLLEPGGPARFQWAAHNPTHRDVFEFGRAAHEVVLGVGASWVESPYSDFRTKESRQWRDDQRAAGITPISGDDATTIRAMADAITRHPGAMEALSGVPEVSLFGSRHGVEVRGRVDVLLDGQITDYKTTASLASPSAFEGSAAKFGYHIQAAHYLDLANELGLEVERFTFVVQEKAAPYLISVLELTPEFIAIGRTEMTRAIEIYAECMATGEWPGHPDETQIVAPPAWLLRQHSAGHETDEARTARLADDMSAFLALA